jgi:calcineurin-like phosphoesterase family protein
MQHEQWVISDHHLFHTNTWLMFKQDGGERLRPFLSNDEMHKEIIEKHNSVVGENDYVYMLGDLSFKYGGELDAILYAMKGKKRFVPGNHDDLIRLAPFLIRHFKKANGVWYSGRGDSEHAFTMSHTPQRLDSIRWGKYNVHGHTHANHLEDTHYINACVEPRKYTPVNFDTIVEEIKQRES